jgi:hypothetical protein
MNSSEAKDDTNATPDVWHVQLPGGELRVLTLEQLDEAFQSGLVTQDTFVYQAGMDDWVKLKELADLSGGEDDTAGENHGVAHAPPSARAPVSVTPITDPFAFPMAASHGGASALVPPIATISLVTTREFGPNSTAPVASDKPDLEFEADLGFRSKRRGGRRVLVAAVVGVVGLVGFAAARGWILKSEASAITPAPAAPPVAEAALLAPIEPAAPPATPTSTANPTRLTDDAKRALLDADKVRAEKARARQRTVKQSAVWSPRRPVKSGTPFHKGGNPHDPLNSAL